MFKLSELEAVPSFVNPPNYNINDKHLILNAEKIL